MSTTWLTKVARVAWRAARLIVVEPRDAVLSARMALWVVLVSVVARLTSLPRAHRIASVDVRSRPSAAADVPLRLARTIDRLLSLDLLVFRRNCWRRAMVLNRYLALHGLETRINFGLQRDAGGRMQGHAWLEYEGQPLLESNASAYVVTFSLPLEPAGVTADQRRQRARC